MSLHTRVVELSGGVTSFTISKLQREDEGVYICTAVNSLGSISCTCTLTVLVIPGAPSDVNAIILGSYNSVLNSWLPQTADGNAPSPSTFWRDAGWSLTCGRRCRLRSRERPMWWTTFSQD